MEGDHSLENSKNFSQLSFPEPLSAANPEESHNNNSLWKETAQVNIDIQRLDNSAGTHNGLESVKSKDGDHEDMDKVSVNSEDSVKRVILETNDFESQEGIVEENEKMQVEESVKEGENKEDNESVHEIEEIKRTKDTNEFEEEVQETDPRERTILLSPDGSPAHLDAEDIRKDLLETDRNNKFKISNKTLSMQEKKARYKELVFTWPPDEDPPCQICLDGEAFDNDDIFLCDLCNCAFHQSCFGSELIDIQADDEQNEWYCHRCSYLMEMDLPFSAVRCEFCPEMKGAIKKIREKSDKHWAHVNCVNWIPEIYYEDLIEKQNVCIAKYWKNNSAGRKKLTCNFCEIKYGDCIGCDGEKCQASFHVICAQIYGLIACWKDMQEMKRENDEEYYLPIYCKNHMKALRKDMYDFSNKIEVKNQNQLSNISYFYCPQTTSTPNKKTPKRKDADQFPASARSSRRRKTSGSPGMEVEEVNKKSLTTPRRIHTKIENEPKSTEVRRSTRPKKVVTKAEEPTEPVASTSSGPKTEENKRLVKRKTLAEKAVRVSKKSDSSKISQKKESSPDNEELEVTKEQTSNKGVTIVEENKDAVSPSKASSSKEQAGNKEVMSSRELPSVKPIPLSTRSPAGRRIPVSREAMENAREVPLFVKAKKTGSFVGHIATRPAKKSVSKDDSAGVIPVQVQVQVQTQVQVASEVINTNIDDFFKKNTDNDGGRSDTSSARGKGSPQEEEKTQKLYKFKPELAEVIKFYEWTTEREIKQTLQDYINQKGLYNRDKKEVEVYKDAELERVLEQRIIQKQDLFKRILPFMYEKKPELLIRDDEDLPFFALYEKEFKKMKEAKMLEALTEKDINEKTPTLVKDSSIVSITEPKDRKPLHGENKQDKVHPPIPVSIHRETSKGDSTSASTASTHKPANQSTQASAKKDTPASQKETVNRSSSGKKNTEETKQQHPASQSSGGLNSKREGSSLFDLLNKGEDIYPSKKVKPSLPLRSNDLLHDTSSFLNSIFGNPTETKVDNHQNKDKNEGGIDVLMSFIKDDKLTFRKNMSWFNKSDETLDGESINSVYVMKTLWPKGADLLF